MQRRRFLVSSLAAFAFPRGRRVFGAPSNGNPSRNYKFQKTISREVLGNYLSRSICMEGLFNGPGDLNDNLRMLTTLGAKYIARSICLLRPGLFPSAPVKLGSAWPSVQHGARFRCSSSAVGFARPFSASCAEPRRRCCSPISCAVSYGVTPENPWAYAIAIPVPPISVFVATLRPALHAASINPVEALRKE
jgi:hypothetical protein